MLFLATVLAATTAMATGTASGNTGPYHVVDSQGTPGVICVYPSLEIDFIKKIKIHAPKVWAFNRTQSVDRETVGWRYQIQYAPNGFPQAGDWQTVVTSTFEKATATDSQKASWQNRTYVFPDYGSAGAYRVKIQIRWFHPGPSHTDGKVTQLLAYYVQHETGIGDFPTGSPWCGGNLG